MRREFKLLIETKDDEPDGYVLLEDMTSGGGMKLACPSVDNKVVGNREVALSFMMRMAAEQMFKRCWPEYITNNAKPQYPEQHGDRIIMPGEPGHSSRTGIDQ